MSFHIFGAILVILQIVSNTSGVFADNLIRFDHLGRSPKYPAGGDFGNGIIDLGGLQVFEAFYFTKLWDTHIGGPDGFGASFYEPASIPKGFNLLGHFCKLNEKPMFASVLTAKPTRGKRGHGALKNPVDYHLIWTSKGVNLTQIQDGYIWLPVAPEGYRAAGYVVTVTPEKPPLDKVKCVRLDFADSTEVDTEVWGFNIEGGSNNVHIFTTKPINGEQSIPTGTFYAQNGSNLNDLACLKMVRPDHYHAMPNSLQIRTILNAYGPMVYLHPDEQYFPSSVLWFFENGVELHQTGQPASPVVNDGANLPYNGTVDDSYIDLPTDKAQKDKVKRGFLHDVVVYVHVKPAFGGTFTDLAIWLFYPFNGGGRFQLGPWTIGLGRIGEHVGDWEHITLRIDNYYGRLKEVYLSQHAKGKWFSTEEFEYVNDTRPVVYSALHGHTHYNAPNIYMHSKSEIDPSDVQMLHDEYSKMNNNLGKSLDDEKFVGFGVRDDAKKSDNVLDIASSYNVVYVDYNAMKVEPWLNFTGRWGPKITYFAKWVMEDTKSLPERVKKLATKLLFKLPPELLGEEGPQGPKMKDSWLGDERV